MYVLPIVSSFMIQDPNGPFLSPPKATLKNKGLKMVLRASITCQAPGRRLGHCFVGITIGLLFWICMFALLHAPGKCFFCTPGDISNTGT